MAPKAEQKIYVGIGLDFETGGLDCRECACTQIALQAVRLADHRQLSGIHFSILQERYGYPP